MAEPKVITMADVKEALRHPKGMKPKAKVVEATPSVNWNSRVEASSPHGTGGRKSGNGGKGKGGQGVTSTTALQEAKQDADAPVTVVEKGKVSVVPRREPESKG